MSDVSRDARRDAAGRMVAAGAIECIAFIGIVAAVYGIWLIYEPAAFIVGGLVLVGCAAIWHRSLRSQ